MRFHTLGAAVIVSLSLMACASSGSQVPVRGGDSELMTVAGEWEGQYTGTESGRSGPIHFSLGEGRHTADGTVVMGGQTPLQIRFVTVEGGNVSGKIEKYTDPSCNCEVETEFVGQRIGDRIDGTFITKVIATGQTQKGTWGVERKPVQ